MTRANRPTRGAAVVLLVGILATLVAACSSGAEQPERSATCGQLQTAVDGAQRDAEVAIAGIATDPAGTRSQLDAITDALTRARTTVTPDEAELVDRAQGAIDRLARQARRAATGKAVDGAAVGDVRTELLDVVKDARAGC